MRKVFFAFLALIAFSGIAFAGDGGNKKAPAANEIQWMTFDEVQVAMSKKPKKVLIDMYTDWCGWCKVMDKKTFSNPELAAYINENFYPVKFNAEAKEPIRFAGKIWEIEPGTKTNKLAIEMVRGQLSYPTTIIMDANFQNPQPIPGYLDVPTMETVMHYLVEGHNKGEKPIPFPEFQKKYVPSWKVLVQ